MGNRFPGEQCGSWYLPWRAGNVVPSINIGLSPPRETKSKSKKDKGSRKASPGQNDGIGADSDDDAMRGRERKRGNEDAAPDKPEDGIFKRTLSPTKRLLQKKKS